MKNVARLDDSMNGCILSCKYSLQFNSCMLNMRDLGAVCNFEISAADTVDWCLQLSSWPVDPMTICLFSFIIDVAAMAYPICLSGCTS